MFASHGGLGVSIRLAKAVIRRGLIDPGCRSITLDHAARTFDMRGRSNGRRPFEAGDWQTVRSQLVERG